VRERTAVVAPGPVSDANLATELLNLGNFLLERDRGRSDEVEKLYRRAAPLLEAAAKDPAIPIARLYLSSCWNNLASIMSNRGRWQEAAEQFEKAIRVRKQLAEEHPGEPLHKQYWSNSLMNLAQVQIRLRDLTAAEESFRQSVGLREELLASSPGVPFHRQELVRSIIELSDLLRARKQYDPALDAADRAIRHLGAVKPEGQWVTVFRGLEQAARASRAATLDKAGRPADAVAEWDRALGIDSQRVSRTEMLLLRAGSVAKTGDPAAVRVAEEIAATATRSVDLYNCACVLALAAAGVRDDAGIGDRYAARAVELLRLAVTAGWRDAAHMQGDSDLDALRRRADFRQLVAELEGSRGGTLRREVAPPPRAVTR
jgi:tetratricopeptide (TPR) repeat protein